VCRSEIDIITGVKFSWAVQPKFVSVDGLCSTAGVVAQDVSMGGGLYSQVGTEDHKHCRLLNAFIAYFTL
jgi:hypothetical protein